MISNTLNSLLRRAGNNSPDMLLWVAGSLIALATPALALLLGEILTLLIETNGTSSSKVAALLPSLGGTLPESSSPLAKITTLLVAGVGIVLLTAVLTYVFYRHIQAVAVGFEISLVSQLRSHAKKLATVRTVSAQQQALVDCLDYHLPRIRACLSRWWRTSPRHFVQLAVCFVVAGLIQPLLTLLTVVATALIVLVYRLLESKQRAALPVIRERAAQERETLIDLCLRGPLLESVHEEGQVEHSFEEQVGHYRRDATRSLTSSSWKTPTVVAVGGVLICLFLFLLSVQILRNEQAFSVGGAFAFALCFIGVFTSISRLQRSLRELKSVESAAAELDAFLALPTEEFNNDELKPISQVRSQIELEHVTLQDSRGRKLLENVSAVFRPGQLIGVAANDAVQGSALAELLLGFGRPVSGRVLIDDTLITDLQPESLRQCGHWVSSDGALLTGSVRDNIIESESHQKDSDLLDLIKATQLTDTMQRLPDGMATIITPADDRLSGDDAFRIGLARANLSGASVIVVEEPDGHFDQAGEQQSLDAIRSLVKHSAITVVIPKRLETLRHCDTVVMLHDHKVLDVGTHSNLIQQNELYRHLNYLRFNPYRALTDEENT